MGIGRRRFMVQACLWTAVAGCRPLWGQEQPGITSAPSLRIPVGARAVGMGTAFAAVASDISTLHYNPGGLANINYREATFMYLKSVQDQNVEYMAFGGPLPFAGFTGAGYSTVGASLLLAQNGSIQVNRTNADGSFLDSRTISAGGDLVATAGYAERLADTPVESAKDTWHFNHFVGASGKFIRSTLAETANASAWAADAGYLCKSPELGWSGGVSMTNLGDKLRFVQEGDPLPLTLRAATAYEWKEPALAQVVTGAADWEYHYYEHQWFVNAGVEYSALKKWAARIGYQFHRDLAGLTLGFGAKYGSWLIDYAWALNDSLGDTHRFSFTFRFGGVPIREREKARRPFMENVPESAPVKEIEQVKPNAMDKPETPRRSAPDSQRGTPGWIY